MAVFAGGASGVNAEVDPYLDSIRVATVARGESHSLTGITGTMTAALAGNSTVFAMRLDPSAGANHKAYITKIELEFTTIVAFTTAVTAGRRLALFRGSGAAASGGTALVASEKDSNGSQSELNSAGGGDCRISSTGALTVTGITYESDPLHIWGLTHVGAAGAFYDDEWQPPEPIVLNPGELLALRNPAAMDAAGTWQLVVNVEWYEGTI